jgi:hypothetical protein
MRPHRGSACSGPHSAASPGCLLGQTGVLPAGQRARPTRSHPPTLRSPWGRRGRRVLCDFRAAQIVRGCLIGIAIAIPIRHPRTRLGRSCDSSDGGYIRCWPPAAGSCGCPVDHPGVIPAAHPSRPARSPGLRLRASRGRRALCDCPAKLAHHECLIGVGRATPIRHPRPGPGAPATGSATMWVLAGRDGFLRLAGRGGRCAERPLKLAGTGAKELRFLTRDRGWDR